MHHDPVPPSDMEPTLSARLIQGDPTAPADLAETFLEPLTQWLRAHNPAIAEDICATAAEDALLALIKNPHSYDPARLSLAAYLHMSASGDLKNALQSEGRHRQRRADLDAVALSPHERKYLWDIESDPARVVEREAMEPPPVVAPPGNLSPSEAAVWALMEMGEHKTTAYALALGITHLPVAAQRARGKAGERPADETTAAGRSDDMSERLAAFARRVERDPFFLGAALADFVDSERLDAQGLAAWLGCPVVTLTLLRLCRRPTGDARAFGADIEAIAARFGVDATALAQAVRRADALAAHREAADGTRRTGGTLMAARDREPSPDEGGGT